MNRLLLLAALAMVPAAAHAADPKKGDEPTEFKDVGLLTLDALRVGDCGTMPAGMKVVSIIDENSAVVNVTTLLASGGGQVPVTTSLVPHHLVARVPTKGLADGSVVDGSLDGGKSDPYWGVIGTQKTARGTLFVVKPVAKPKGLGDLRAEVVKPKEPEKEAEKKPEPKQLPRATITPPKGEPVTIAEAQYFLAAGKKEPAQMDKWEKDGKAKRLSAATEVEVVGREKDYSRIKIDGKEWVVETRWLPEEKK